MVVATRRRCRIRVAVTVVAGLALIAHLLFPDIKIDSAALVLAAIALLPWLGELLESFEFPGGWKFKFHSLEKRQNQLELAAEETKARAAEATSTAQAAFGAAQTSELSAAPATMDTVGRLVAEYSRLRAQPRTPTRNSELDRLFGAMVANVPNVPDFDPTVALRDTDGGLRFAGYAYLYGRPDPARLTDVVDALLLEQTGINQYWAIRTVAVLLEHADPSSVPDTISGHLRELMSRQRIGSARHAKLAELLHTLRAG